MAVPTKPEGLKMSYSCHTDTLCSPRGQAPWLLCLEQENAPRGLY